MIIGKVLSGRYEIIEKVGEGGTAFVFKARCRLLKRNVAVKILKPEFTKDEKFIESFRRESQASASLSHPNIVNVYDVGVEGKNIHYIVMEYVGGSTLSELIEQKKKIPVKQAVNIAKQIASALNHAHKNHIIHRDIKPHNILLTKEGRVKVTDFGIAKAVTSSTIVSGENVMGSVHYFSPEQARGGYIDEKSDIYSLGIVLYEMITGRLPFEGDSPVSVAMKHISEPLKLEESTKIPKSLETIILTATQKIQIKRYHSALEILNDLEKVFTSLDYQITYKDSDDNKATRVMPVITDSGEKSVLNMTKKNKRKINVKKSPFLRKKFLLRIGAIVSAIFLAFLFSNTLMFLKDFIFVKEINVPDMVYFDYAEAMTLLDEKGLDSETNEKYSTSVAKGQVISQEPEAGTIVKEGAVVHLIISKGERIVEMPILVNKKLDDALFLLEKNHLEEGIIVREASELPVGVVIRQDPEGKEEVKENTEVDLVVSDGIKIETILMINVLGKSIDEAESDIESAGLKMGTTEYISTDEYDKGQVISQSIEAGTEIEENTVVNLEVSKGADQADAEETEEAEETNQPVDEETFEVSIRLFYDQAQNDIFTIKIFKIQDDNIEMIYNEVHNKENSGKEDIIISGSGKARIAIYFDDAMIAEKNLDFETGQFYD